MKQFVYNNRYMLVALAVLLLYLSPNIFFPHKARYLIHDNLDSNVVWYKNLAESGKMFAGNHEIVPNSLGGIPRGCYPSEFFVPCILYTVFSPLAAYNLNIVLSRVLAFFCMFLLLRRFVFQEDMKNLAPVSIALLYALLPFWPSGSLTMATQPLLLMAFLNVLYGHQRSADWIVISLVPFLTVLVHSNLFLIFALGVYGLIISFIKRSINFRFFLALALYCLVSVVVEYRLFMMEFVEKFESHRTLLDRTSSMLNIKGVLGVSVLHFIKGHYHFHSVQFPIILITAAVALFVAGSNRWRLVASLAGLYSVSVLYILPQWKLFGEMYRSVPLLTAVSGRFYSLFPLFWFIVFAFSVKIILHDPGKLLRGVTYCLIAFMVVSLFFSWFSKDYYSAAFAENSFCNTIISPDSEEHSSFDDYYKPELFAKVKHALPAGEYYVGCLGLDPAIAQYNGLKTIDGYFFYYPRSAAMRMNKICAEEHRKDNIRGVDSRCNLYSSQIARGKSIIDTLELDYSLLYASNTRFLLSTKKVVHSNLVNENIVNDESLRIFIYKLAVKS